MEGNSLEIVKAFNQDGICWGLYGQAKNDTKFLLTSFHSWEVHQVLDHRTNYAAHGLAKQALTLERDKGITPEI